MYSVLGNRIHGTSPAYGEVKKSPPPRPKCEHLADRTKRRQAVYGFLDRQPLQPWLDDAMLVGSVRTSGILSGGKCGCDDRMFIGERHVVTTSSYRQTIGKSTPTDHTLSPERPKNVNQSLSPLILLNKRNTDLSGRLKKIKTEKKQPKWYVRWDSNRGHLHTLPLSHAGVSAGVVHWTYLTQFSHVIGRYAFRMVCL